MSCINVQRCPGRRTTSWSKEAPHSAPLLARGDSPPSVLHDALKCACAGLIRLPIQVQTAEQARTPASRFQSAAAPSTAGGNPAGRSALRTDVNCARCVERPLTTIGFLDKLNTVLCCLTGQANLVQMQGCSETCRIQCWSCNGPIQPGHRRLQPCTQEQTLGRSACRSISSPSSASACKHVSAASSYLILPAAWGPSQCADQTSCAVHIHPSASCSASTAGDFMEGS